LKYVVGGQTYWDNNNNSNYSFVGGNAGYGPGPMLGNDVNVLVKSASLGGNLYAYIDVRNIAPTKTVTLTYTANNWATTTTLSGGFLSWYQTGWSTYLSFPNAYGVERWLVAAPVAASQIQFYIAYTVNGVTYYDNNYGANYVVGS
jgi:hypothetical protein